MNIIKNMSLVLAILLSGFMLQSCASPGRVNYGVSVNYRTGWGHGPSHHQSYRHHRPPVRHHGGGGHGKPPRR